MKAVVYTGPFNVAVEEVPDPRIEHPSDVIVQLTPTAICGSDLHLYEGRTATEPGMVFGREVDKRVARSTKVVLHPGT